MNSRKDARQAVAAGIQANVSGLQAVYDRETPDFGRLSPVCMVYSNGTRPGLALTLGAHARDAGLFVALWWKWAETTEDDLDDLSEATWDYLESVSGPTADWDGLDIDEQLSAMDYPIVDGVQYRRETIAIVVW